MHICLAILLLPHYHHNLFICPPTHTAFYLGPLPTHIFPLLLHTLVYTLQFLPSCLHTDCCLICPHVCLLPPHTFYPHLLPLCLLLYTFACAPYLCALFCLTTPTLLCVPWLPYPLAPPLPPFWFWFDPRSTIILQLLLTVHSYSSYLPVPLYSAAVLRLWIWLLPCADPHLLRPYLVVHSHSHITFPVTFFSFSTFWDLDGSFPAFYYLTFMYMPVPACRSAYTSPLFCRL